MHFEDAGAGDERKGFAVFTWFKVGAILAIILLPAAIAAAATAATIAPALTGTAVVSSALAVIVVAVPTATSAAPSFSLGHVTQSLNLLPATAIEIARGRKKEKQNV
jgi:hypothetical protein